jgi:hypothetical protein
VVEPKPVAGLVCHGATQICRSSGTPREGSEVHDNTVIFWVAIVVGGEGGETEETICSGIVERNGENVESVGTATPKGCLHLSLFRGLWTNIIEPFGVDDPGYIEKLELKASSTVIPVQDVDLILDLFIPGMLRV